MSDYTCDIELDGDEEKSIYPVSNIEDGKMIYEYHFPNFINEDVIENLFKASIEDDEFLGLTHPYSFTGNL